LKGKSSRSKAESSQTKGKSFRSKGDLLASPDEIIKPNVIIRFLDTAYCFYFTENLLVREIADFLGLVLDSVNRLQNERRQKIGTVIYDASTTIGSSDYPRA
jgi:hypothetical protein